MSSESATHPRSSCQKKLPTRHVSLEDNGTVISRLVPSVTPDSIKHAITRFSTICITKEDPTMPASEDKERACLLYIFDALPAWDGSQHRFLRQKGTVHARRYGFGYMCVDCQWNAGAVNICKQYRGLRRRSFSHSARYILFSF